MRQVFLSMSQRSRAAFLVGLVVIAGLVGGFAWWVMHPPYGVLFGQLRESDAAEITAALTQMQVPFRLADEGKTILVPDEQIYGTRMKLVSQGVPKGGSVGFELFKDSDYGVTEFAQRVNYQRAMQGELERTIASLTEVSSARVHLMIHHSGLFDRDQDASKASVTIALRPLRRLDARAVAGVQRLVASAVEDLTPAEVVVLDDKGVVLSGGSTVGQGAAQVGDRLDQQAQLESRLKARVGELLSRVLSNNDFTVSVDVRLNYDHVKQVSERLLAQGKNGNGLLVSEKIDASGHQIDASGAPQAGTGATSSNREVEYAHGKEQEEIERAMGRVERISVGIVVPSSLNTTEIQRLSDVVSAGIGLDPVRGDKVDIAAIASPIKVNAPSESLAALAPASTPNVAAPLNQASTSSSSKFQWSLPWAWSLAAVIAVMLVVLVLVGAIASGRQRPRRLSAEQREATIAQLRQWVELTEVKS